MGHFDEDLEMHQNINQLIDETTNDCLLESEKPVPNKERRPVIEVIESTSHKWWVSFLYYLLLFGLCIGLTLSFGIARIDGSSMDPTLKDGDIKLFHKFGQPQYGDILVLEERLVDDYPSQFIIKRLIGKGGDHIEVQHGHLYRNGELVVESYLARDDHTDGFSKERWEITVPDGYYFVLGDHRDVSNDSRQVGSFKESAVLGILYNGRQSGD